MIQVILVDDNIRAIEGLRRHIPWEETGCVCVGTASNGVEALELCRSLHPGVVITDVRMPQMDGLELCRRLRQEFPGIHLIVISAYDDFSYAQNAMAYGVENYILKPIDNHKIGELARMLREISHSSQDDTRTLSAFFNSSIVADLTAAINEGSAGRVEALIRERMNPAEASFRAAADMGIHLIAALYHHMTNIGMTGQVDGRSLAESLSEFQALRSPHSAVDYVVRQYRWVSEYVARSKNPNAEGIVERVKQFIDENYSDPEITTYSIARQFHLSQSYLCQLYRNVEKTSINAYITKLRIERAEELIATSGLPVKEISKKVGYPDAHYFARVFKKLKGMAPSEYKGISRQNG